MLAGLMSYYFF